MELKYIKVEVKDFIAVVTMDRPPVNAQNSDFRNEMIQVFDSFNDRDDVRVAILTGAGNTFSAGADIKERKDSIAEPGDYWRLNRAAREYTNSIRECAKPVIAAVNGAALGAGFGLMAACDIMLASENATFGMPEINVGLAGAPPCCRAWCPSHAAVALSSPVTVSPPPSCTAWASSKPACRASS